MADFRDKMMQFMHGRYGQDQLNRGMMGLAIILLILNIFIGSPVLAGITLFLMLSSMFRMYSRNMEKRTRENEKFMRLWKPVRKKIRLCWRRIKEGKTHRFRTCPGCKAVIRMPRRRGVRTISCPTCRTDFQTRILI